MTARTRASRAESARSASATAGSSVSSSRPHCLIREAPSRSINISSSSVEHSVLSPDEGEVLDKYEIQVRSIFDYCIDNNVKELDFVKIEAEGVELEVFDGLGKIRPRKLAIDVSPERNGKSPVDELVPRLSRLGYESRKRGNVLFARLPIISVS